MTAAKPFSETFHRSKAAITEQTVHVGGFDTIIATRAELAQIMVKDCRARSPDSFPKLVFSSNGQGIALAGADHGFAEVMAAADIVHADGMSVVTASRLLTKTPLPERICTTDFFHDAAQAAVEAGLSFYMFGGKEEQNKAAAEEMQRQYPTLKFAGRRNGYFKPSEEEAICEEIRRSGADVLWVALGKPKQESWSVRNRENLRGVGWVKTCGGLYGYFAGEEKRAPLWVRQAGFEWVYRLLQDPRRLLWRYLITNPQSFYLLLSKTTSQKSTTA